MKKIIATLVSISAMFVFATSVSAKGFDQSGYNDRANLFNGTVMQWCMDKTNNQSYCNSVYGFWGNDKLMMKWNDEWNRGNDENWANPPYKAWLSNLYNGRVPNGSGEVWHYKIVWVGDYTQNPNLVPEGGYGVWGQFAVIMDQGVNDTGHVWYTLAKPAGYGAY